MSDDSPSCSKSVEIKTSLDNDNDNMELFITDDKAEIERLESSEQQPEKDEKIEEPVADDERIAKIEFHCTLCDMHEMVHYFGTEPPFVFGIRFNEPTYVMRDPFQAPPPRWKPKAEYFVALGAHCQKCDAVVCKDNECSFYYVRTFCLPCARKEATNLPVDIQQKLRKQLAMI